MKIKTDCWVRLKFSRELFYCLLSLLFPLSTQFIWLLHNTQLPRADAVEQLATSYHIFAAFKAHHWGNFFSELYMRHYQWRPTGFYLLEFPFQILSGGDMMFTTRGVTLLCTLVSCIYLYLLLRIWLAPLLSVLATTLLGVMPSVAWSSTFLAFSEIAFLPAILAAIYHLIR